MRKSAFGLAGLCLMAGTAFAQTPNPKIADAGPNDLRVLAFNSLRTALDEGKAGAEKATGHHIVFEYGTATGNLQSEVLAGQDFEVALLVPEANETLAKAGKTAPGQTHVVVGSMGFALQGDVTVSVSSPDAIRKTLLGAKAVVFSPNSSGIASIQKMLGALGIADTIKHVNSSGGDVKLAPGEYQIYLYPMSEIVTHQIVTTPAWKNLGPFPAQWEIPVVAWAVTGSHARDPAATKSLMDYLMSPAMTAIFVHDGWAR